MDRTPYSPPPRNFRNSSRSERRRALNRALMLGFGTQVALTAVLWGGLHLAGFGLDKLAQLPLLWAATFAIGVPAYLAHFLTGYAAPFIRWWHMLVLSCGAVALLVLAGVLLPGARLPEILSAYLTMHLLLGPAAGAYGGQWLREKHLEEEALQPRPWGESFED